jgi:hypothetical protein
MRQMSSLKGIHYEPDLFCHLLNIFPRSNARTLTMYLPVSAAFICVMSESCGLKELYLICL